MRSHAIYAGTFDPLTLGHYDLVVRAAHIVDRLTLAVAANPRKQPLFALEERVAMAREALAAFPNVEVEPFDELVVNYARRRGVKLLVRGLRAFSDFEFEFQMALMNRQLAPEIETLFLMPKEEHSYVSSSSVREIAQYGGEITAFVPPNVATALWRVFPRKAPPC